MTENIRALNLKYNYKTTFGQIGVLDISKIPYLRSIRTFWKNWIFRWTTPAKLNGYAKDFTNWTRTEGTLVLYHLGKSSILMFMDIRLCYCLREKIHYQRRQRFMLGEETEKANDEIPWAYLNEKREKEKRSWCMISHIHTR